MGILIKFNAYYLLKKPSMKIEIIDKSKVRIRWNTPYYMLKLLMLLRHSYSIIS